MGSKARTPALNPGLSWALEAVADFLTRKAGQAMVMGGIAVIARGVQRLTRDVDVAVAGGRVPLTTTIRELERAGIFPRIPDALAFATENQVLLMRHAKSGIDIDVSLAWLPFELEAITAASLETMAGVRLPVARAEDLIIFKAVAWRPQDQQDVERLLAVHGSRIDLARIRRHVIELGNALEIDRIREIDDLIARVVVGPHR